MKILVINCGSSSLKFQIIEMIDESVLAKGNVERIGLQGSFLKYQFSNKEKVIVKKQIDDHTQALKIVMETLMDKKTGIIKDVNEISAIGHRVVHGGEFFSESVIIDDNVVKAIEDCIDLAPLHNPPNLMGIQACKNIMPDTPMVAVFDTAFHHTMPKYAYIYSIPYEMYNKYKIRKYGFHGISHKYVAYRAAEMLGKYPSETKIVSCHLGNGASVCGILNGKSIDTSMGFTPLAGLEMGTRSGNIDPSTIMYIMEKENLSAKDMENVLNEKSGMLGISGVSSDCRDVEEEAIKGNERAQLALDVFAYRVKKYISMYIGIMGGIDALVFTAGIGEMSSFIRYEVTKGLECFGIEVDSEKNKTIGQEIDISKDDAKVRTLVIPTNEELMIARETVRTVK